MRWIHFWSVLTILGTSWSFGSQSGPLTAEEENTVSVFQRTSQAIVHINARQKLVRKFEDITPQSGVGTGFFFDTEGHVLTSYHVIKDSNEIEVISGDGEALQTILVGTAPSLDLAVLKVKLPPSEIAPITFGDSDSLQIGQKVMTVGHPLALHNSLTVGIVSALHRTLSSLSPELEGSLIQTDVAINPGNSGGPLLNSRGEVIGIVTASAEGQNLGFAVPSSFARQVIPDLIQMGHRYRPGLGFTGQPLNPYLSSMFGIPLSEGFLVEAVAFDSPADLAGLRAGHRAVTYGENTVVLGGDIVTALNGQKVRTLGEIARGLMGGHPGQKITLTVFRDGRNAMVEFVLKPMH